MSVLLSLLAPGCQTQPGPTEVTRQQPQQPSSEQWPGSSLSPLKAFLWGKLGAHSHRGDCIKMSSGAQWASFPWLSCSDSHIHSDWKQIWDDSDEAWGLWWKGTERHPIGCLHVSGENVDACLPPSSYSTDKAIHTHTHAQNCVCTQECYSTQLTVSTFTHSNFNLSQSSQSTRHFVVSGIFIFSQKCLFGR